MKYFAVPLNKKSLKMMLMIKNSIMEGSLYQFSKIKPIHNWLSIYLYVID